MVGKGIPRSHYEVAINGEIIGHVTTGMHSPTFQKPIGLALIDSRYSIPGTEIDIMIRGKAVKTVVGRAYSTAKEPSLSRVGFYQLKITGGIDYEHTRGIALYQ